MIISNLTNSTKTIRLKPDQSGWTVVAGTTDVQSDIVDTAGFDGLRFIAGFGAITSGAVTSIKVQENSANSLTGMTDLTGSAQTVADTDDNKIVISEVILPLKRYLCLYIDRGTQNAVVDFVTVELFRSRNLPVTQDTATVSGTPETWVSPAEGTA